jgi:hypothetical protein
MHPWAAFQEVCPFCPGGPLAPHRAMPSSCIIAYCDPIRQSRRHSAISLSLMHSTFAVRKAPGIPLGMCVKLSAESAMQQSPGRKSERSELWNPGFQSRIKISPERAEQGFCIALSGLIPFSFTTQGFGCFAASTLGFAASSLRDSMRWVSLTCMPSGSSLLSLLYSPGDPRI